VAGERERSHLHLRNNVGVGDIAGLSGYGADCGDVAFESNREGNYEMYVRKVQRTLLCDLCVSLRSLR
jgi:hypothetical protein